MHQLKTGQGFNPSYRKMGNDTMSGRDMESYPGRAAKKKAKRRKKRRALYGGGASGIGGAAGGGG